MLAGPNGNSAVAGWINHRFAQQIYVSGEKLFWVVRAVSNRWCAVRIEPSSFWIVSIARDVPTPPLARLRWILRRVSTSRRRVLPLKF